MTDPLCRRCHLPIEKPANGLRRSRKYHPRCGREAARAREKERYAVRHPRRMALPKLAYGPVFRRNAVQIREQDNRTCVRCPKYPAAIVDHIIPLRLLIEWAANNRERNRAHDKENLWTLCQSCSGIKTGIDLLAKSADFVGFAGAIRAFCGGSDVMEARFLEAAKHFGIEVYWQKRDQVT